jgi:hypothetical protein
MIPPNFTLTHVTVNTGHSMRKAVFEDPSPEYVAAIAAHFKPLLDSGLATVLPGMDAGLLDTREFGEDCAAWFLFPTGDKASTVVTCFASLRENADLFSQAVELAREQFTSFAGALDDAGGRKLDDSFLAPYSKLTSPSGPWLATVLHLGMGTFPRELMSHIPDLNQCLAAAALHHP